MAVPASLQQITLGCVIVLAVGVDMWRSSISNALSRLFRQGGMK
jgi:ribose transport system permease protein